VKAIKTLIIDDEVSALITLKGMLQQACPQVSIMGEATSVKEALKIVTQEAPELVFLDIQMSPFSGFDFLELTPQYQYGVIFTTAHPEFAIEAIKIAQPWSFLVKPYGIDSLVEAVQIATKKIADAESKAEAKAEAPTSSDNQGIILQDSRKGNIVVKVRDIQYCKSDGALLEIYVSRNGKTEKFVQYQTLKNMEAELPDNLFCRVHHGYIVNLAFVARYEITKSVRIVYLENGKEIPVSIQKAGQFVEKMGEFLK